MKALWQRWVGLWSLRELPTMLALIRIFVGLVLLWDFAEIGLHGIADELWSPEEYGGLPSRVLQRAKPPEIFGFFDPGPELAWGLWGFILLMLVLWTLGVAPAVVGVLLVLAYAQTALILPLGDRGIDLALRNVMLILVFSRCGDTLSLPARLKTGSWLGDGSLAPAWPRHLIIIQLVLIYFLAGVQKTALTWTPLGGYNALYVVLHDPHIARFDWAGMGWLDGMVWPLRIGTAATKLFEWGAPLFLLAYWFRLTADRGGRLRSFFLRFDVRLWLVTVGAILHLGIALTMQLGIFPWAMLALYPAFFHPDELQALLARIRGRRTE